MKINVLIRNKNNIIESVQTIDYDDKKIDDLSTLALYLNDKNKIEEYYECEYDIECKKNYLYYLAKRNKELKLDVNFTDLPFNKYYSTTKSKVLSINAYPVEGGLGCVGGIISLIIELLNIKEILMFVYNIFRYIYLFIKLHFILLKKNMDMVKILYLIS